MRITASQFRKIATPRKLSKKNMERVEKGLDPIENEDTAQEKVVQYLETLKKKGHVVKFTSIPNSTRTPYESVKVKNRLTGLRPGLCDLLIIYRVKINEKYRSLWIEMKRESGGKVQDNQKEWISVLNHCEGTFAFVAKGYEDAKNIIDSVIFYGKNGH